MIPIRDTPAEHDGDGAAAGNGDLSTWRPAAGQVDEVTAAEPAPIDVDRLTQIVLLAGVAAAALAAVVVLAKACRA